MVLVAYTVLFIFIYKYNSYFVYFVPVKLIGVSYKLTKILLFTAISSSELYIYNIMEHMGM